MNPCHSYRFLLSFGFLGAIAMLMLVPTVTSTSVVGQSIPDTVAASLRGGTPCPKYEQLECVLVPLPNPCPGGNYFHVNNNGPIVGWRSTGAAIKCHAIDDCVSLSNELRECMVD